MRHYGINELDRIFMGHYSTFTRFCSQSDSSRRGYSTSVRRHQRIGGECTVDAGAKTINVLVVDAGRTSIQVIDDGKGMSETDARLSFERHATSKIRKGDDLFALHTMGFKTGEALASIAAVAQIELETRQTGEDVGTYLSISGSKFTGQEPCSCPEGSNFNVENLFSMFLPVGSFWSQTLRNWIISSLLSNESFWLILRYHSLCTAMAQRCSISRLADCVSESSMYSANVLIRSASCESGYHNVQNQRLRR